MHTNAASVFFAYQIGIGSRRWSPTCLIVSHAPDSLRESLVHYSRAVRSGLE